MRLKEAYQLLHILKHVGVDYSFVRGGLLPLVQRGRFAGCKTLLGLVSLQVAAFIRAPGIAGCFVSRSLLHKRIRH